MPRSPRPGSLPLVCQRGLRCFDAERLGALFHVHGDVAAVSLPRDPQRRSRFTLLHGSLGGPPLLAHHRSSTPVRGPGPRPHFSASSSSSSSSSAPVSSALSATAP